MNRQNGKTFAYIIKELLDDSKDQITVKEFVAGRGKYMQPDTHYSNYESWFRHEVLNINNILIQNGIQTWIVSEPLIPKINYLQLWFFYNWLMHYKKYSIDKIANLSNKEFEKEMQNKIVKENSHD